jgi:hypothetical protein
MTKTDVCTVQVIVGEKPHIRSPIQPGTYEMDVWNITTDGYDWDNVVLTDTQAEIDADQFEFYLNLPGNEDLIDQIEKQLQAHLEKGG